MALTLTACQGEASSSGSNTKRGNDADGKLLSRSMQLFRDASSVRVTARSAVAMGSAVEISVDRDKNCRVDAQNGFFRVAVERGGRTWMKWREDLLDNAATTPDGERLDKALGGKWLELGQDGRIRKSMVDLCTMASLHNVANVLADPRQRAIREPETTENGERVVPVRRGEDRNSVTAYVAVGEKPYPRKLVVDIATFSPTPVEFKLDAYGEPVTVTPPPASLTVRSAPVEALAEKNLAAGLPGS
ncbi:hypothetical protein [Streptomyces lavendulae]|uniref:hypothetical protein n=1 Tax=Streptomyces lavendulae TaxID=1914 RepID=UPI0033E43CB7